MELSGRHREERSERLTSRRGLTSPALWLRWRVRCWRWARTLGGRLLCSGSRGSMKVVARQLWSTKKGCGAETVHTRNALDYNNETGAGVK